MPTEVVMPQMGESIFEGTITKWLKQPGDKITRDEPLFEISTDKVDAEIPAPASGVLREIKAEVGKTVQVNAVVAVIDESEDSATASGESCQSLRASGCACHRRSGSVRQRRKEHARGRRSCDRCGHAADGRIDLRGNDHQVAQEGGRPGNRATSPCLRSQPIRWTRKFLRRFPAC